MTNASTIGNVTTNTAIKTAPNYTNIINNDNYGKGGDRYMTANHPPDERTFGQPGLVYIEFFEGGGSYPTRIPVIYKTLAGGSGNISQIFEITDINNDTPLTSAVFNDHTHEYYMWTCGDIPGKFAETDGGGTIKFKNDTVCEIFMIGGGGGGHVDLGGPGGAGAYLQEEFTFLSNVEYRIIVGKGGDKNQPGNDTKLIKYDGTPVYVLMGGGNSRTNGGCGGGGSGYNSTVYSPGISVQESTYGYGIGFGGGSGNMTGSGNSRIFNSGGGGGIGGPGSNGYEEIKDLYDRMVQAFECEEYVLAQELYEEIQEAFTDCSPYCIKCNC